MAHVGAAGMYSMTQPQVDEDWELQLALAISASEVSAQQANPSEGWSGDGLPPASSTGSVPSFPTRVPDAAAAPPHPSSSRSLSSFINSVGRVAQGIKSNVSQAISSSVSGGVGPQHHPQPATPPTGVPYPSGYAPIGATPAGGALVTDEELARQLQQQYDDEVGSMEAATGTNINSNNISSSHLPPASAPPRAPIPSPPSNTGSFTGMKDRCAGCNYTFSFMNGMDKILALGRSWHAGCFLCAGCGKPLMDSGAAFVVGSDNKPYHSLCHKHRWMPKCHVCHNFVPEKSTGEVTWHQHPFWRDMKYCPHHADDATPRCCSCQRLQSHQEEWPTMEDGRYLCYTCMGTVVTDTNDAQPLYQEIVDFFRRLGLQLPYVPPLTLCDGHTLSAASDGVVGGRDNEGPVFHTRGICMFEERTTYTTSALDMMLGRGAQVVSPHTTVTAILVLKGLPRLLTGSIMAHELMHAHFRLNGFGRLAPEIEEGLCQMMAYLWLDQQQLTKGSADERLASFFAHEIRSDKSLVYGDGFRAAFEAFQKFGLYRVLSHVHSTKFLPS